MLPSDIISHRGFWLHPEEKNSMVAFERALQAGFSIETDFRDRAGALVIGHDPPAAGKIIGAEAFFDLCREHEHSGTYVAANIKADGLYNMLIRALEVSGTELGRGYVFDMSVPDTLGYLDLKIPFFTRMSEYEPDPAFSSCARGVWVDNFSGRFSQVDQALACLESGFRVAFVSPELHGRPHEKVWSDIRAKRLCQHPGFAICTDFPSVALKYFLEI